MAATNARNKVVSADTHVQGGDMYESNESEDSNYGPVPMGPMEKAILDEGGSYVFVPDFAVHSLSIGLSPAEVSEIMPSIVRASQQVANISPQQWKDMMQKLVDEAASEQP